MSEDKRRASRFAIWFPVQLDTAGDVIIGISRDLSEVGVMMVAAAEPVLGAKVSMSISIPGDDEGTRTLSGTIVRVQPNEADSEACGGTRSPSSSMSASRPSSRCSKKCRASRRHRHPRA